MIVDAHQHFWDPARAEYAWMTDEVAALRRRFHADDLQPLLREHGVAGTVVVQARQSLDETRDLLAIAASTPFVLGVVGWIDLAGDVKAQLSEFEHTPLVGIRHLVHDEADPEWLLRDDVQRGVAALAELPNVVCKISGLFTEADPAGTAARALQWFGPERCMWGSDWPVTLLAGGYGDGLAIVGSDPRVLAGTAIATYRLQLP